MISRQKLSDQLTLSRFSLGVWRMNDWKISGRELLHFFEHVVDLGITTIDHADIYGSYTCEAIFGEIVHGGLRKKMELVTKCGIKLVSPNRPEHSIKTYDTSKEHILSSVEQSLKNLRTDYLDLLLLHRPNPLMNADIIAEAFHELHQSGKVLGFGVSNFTPSQISLLQSRFSFKLMTNQIQFSVLYVPPLSDGSLDQAQQLQMPPMIWSPLAGGNLFGTGEHAWRVRTELASISTTYGASIEQIALSWILKHASHPMPILGSGKLERIKDCLKSESIPLSDEDWFRILRSSVGSDVP